MQRLNKKILPISLAAVLLWVLAAAIPAAAQSVLGGGGLDSDKPIEITADSLEVHQAQQQAVFAGNVQVVQGNIRMRANKLVVHYSDKKSAKKTGDPADIRRIDASGKVFLASPRETAQGDSGVYDVVNKRIDLQGNVVLTQGKNVLRGDKMTLDLVSGKSRVEGGAASESGSGGRVKGIFVPEKTVKE